MILSSFLYTRHSQLLTSILKMEKVKYTQMYSRELFDTSPRNSTLFGISEMLDKYNIETESYQIEEKEKINLIPTPFVAETETENILVLCCDNDTVTFLRQGKKEKMTKDFFISIWDGSILLFEKNSQSIEPDYIFNRLKSISIDACLLYLCAFIFTFLTLHIIPVWNNTWIYYIFILSNLLGAYVSLLLFMEMFENTQERANKICKLLNQKSNCDEITNSDQGKLFGVISWSEIGLAYFIVNALFVIIYPISLFSILFINSFALLYTCWSIWYQNKVGKWCALCLLVQSVFIFNFILGLISFELVYLKIEFRLICFIFFIYAFLFSLIYLSKYPLIWFFERNNFKKELAHFKSDKDVFSALVERLPQIPTYDFKSSIYKGNRNSSCIVTIITNPHCTACTILHKKLKRVEKHIDAICIQYVLAINNNEKDNDARLLIAAALNKDTELIDLWFQTKDKSLLYQKYSYDLYTDNINKEYFKHKSFVEYINPKGTPTVLINGAQLPDYYHIDDIIESNLIPL
ncbi:vitamin K epoxide reductase family protein [Massilibacteroides vaginae]|uniref:vitamin K epoxide reductase family protein n=1 Tax=Massilibacteroides vaginae TaxID=1673718 RepID=UPI000A1CDE4E|nr:vitamin K epoxide reductase family protein [Massilibacteroides vaginae]